MIKLYHFTLALNNSNTQATFANFCSLYFLFLLKKTGTRYFVSEIVLNTNTVFNMTLLKYQIIHLVYTHLKIPQLHQTIQWKFNHKTHVIKFTSPLFPSSTCVILESVQKINTEKFNRQSIINFIRNILEFIFVRGRHLGKRFENLWGHVIRECERDGWYWQGQLHNIITYWSLRIISHILKTGFI